MLFGAVTRGPRRQVSLQHRADDERRGRRHRHLRQGVPDAVRRVHPVLRRDPVVHEAVPRGVELQPRQRAGDLSAAGGRPRLPAGPADLLRGHPPRLRPPRGEARARTRSSTSPTTPGSAAPPSPTSTSRSPCSVRSSTASRWSAPSTRACPRTSTPRAGSATQTESVDPAELPPPTPKTLLVELAMLPGGGLYRHIGDLFGFGCLAALAVILVRSRRRTRRT